MSSFLFGTEYGTDQISAGSDNIRDYLNKNDSNELSQINAIRDKEMRLFKKLNSYTPTCESNKNRKFMDYCQQSVYADDGMHREKLRQDIINDIENKFFSGQEIRGHDCIPDKKEKIKSEGFNNGNRLDRLDNFNNFNRLDNGNRLDNFNRLDNSNNINSIQNKIYEIEKKNDMLLLFIFFLVIVVIIQYTKNIDKMHIMTAPTQQALSQTGPNQQNSQTQFPAQ